MRQYVVKEAYSGNYWILQYDNKLEKSRILDTYEVAGYVAALIDMGYERAYYVPEYQAKVRDAQEELDAAKSAYEEAIKHPLVLSEEEFAKYRSITDTAE